MSPRDETDDDGGTGEGQPFFATQGAVLDRAVPCCVAGDPLYGGFSVMGCGSEKHFGRSRRTCAGVCVCRFSASICASVSFSVAARSCSRTSAASSACFLRRDRCLQTEAIVML